MRRSRSVPPGFLGRAVQANRKWSDSDTFSQSGSSSVRTIEFTNSPLKVVGKRCTIFGRAGIQRAVVSNAGLCGRSNSASRVTGRSASRNQQLLTCGLSEHEVLELMQRDITPEDYDMLLRLDASLPKRTANKSILEKLRPVPFADRQHNLCGVCLMHFELEDDILAVPCPGQHEFHRACISKWLVECKNCCPVDHVEIL